MPRDWRIEHLETQPYLKSIRLKRKSYKAPRPDWDHDHCVACWQKLMEADVKADGIEHEGYATCADFVRGAEYEWVCVACFQDLAEEMGWTDATEDPIP